MAGKHPTEVIGEMFPLDGPFSHERTVQAAQCVAELVRYLNHATFTAEGVPYPATVYDLIGNLKGALSGLDQTLRQSADMLVEVAAQPEARQYDYTDARWPAMPGPQSTARMVGAYCERVRAALGDGSRLLGDAQVYAGRLYLDADGGQ